ncbi:MAG: hypothetical protein IKA85_00270 [Clostridia bacterium]|nr:hypothetical protein [Clostridia bacterium]
MKNIYLIGDSIRFGALGSPGYGVYVKEMLEGKAKVYAPGENCRFAQYTLRYLHEWASNVEKEKIDIVHWNNGLWDVLRLFGDEPLTDIDTYGIMLKRVYKRIRFLFPNARVIFALSTSVIEEWARPEFFRYNSEIEKYNQKAREVMSELGVQVNDLYTLSASFDNSLHSDWVHFGVEGSKILAEKVIEACIENEK